jgi:pimeloyl-ACP methyl ester carboxylesterase
MVSLLDRVTVGSAALLSRRGRFFADGVLCPTLGEHFDVVALTLPSGLSRPEDGEVREVHAETASGNLGAAYQIAQWLGPDHPLIVFHHGSNERPYDYSRTAKNTFKRVFFSRGGTFPANLVNLRAPFHQSLKEYAEGIRELHRFGALLMTSVALVEEVVRHARAGGIRQVVVCGCSLGGWVTNLHRAYSASADVYVPMLAGAALGDMFVDSVYRRLVGGEGRRRPEVVRKALNFEEEFAANREANVFPLLARHDAIVVFERQKRCYEGRHPLAVIDRGHTSGMLAPLALRRHLGSVLDGKVPA